MRDHEYVVFLASASDSARNRERTRLSMELLRASTIDYQRVAFDDAGRFAQACAAISLGDYVSFYLALLYGVDPSKTEALTLVKTQMGEFDPLAEEHQQMLPTPDSGTDGNGRLM